MSSKISNNYGKIIEGLGLLVGMIIGAGMFALPFSFSKVGLWRGLFLFALVFFLSLILHLRYAAVIYATPGRHRFPGYVNLHLGKEISCAVPVPWENPPT